MKKLEQRFTEFSSPVRLTETEKNAMREYLFEYQALQPISDVTNPFSVRHDGRAIPSPLSFFSFKKPMPLVAALMLFLTGTVGVSAAAQDALPGDILYPVKVSVNEKVSGAFAFSDEAKVAHDIALADTRLSEAESLAAKGKLSSSTEETLSAQFAKTADSAKERIVALEGRNADAAAISETRLNAVLSAHATILADASGDAPERAGLIASVREHAVSDSAVSAAPVPVVATMAAKTAAFSASADTEASVSVSGSESSQAARAMRTAALSSYTKAQAVVKHYGAKLSAEARASANGSLAAARALIDAGDVAVEEDADTTLAFNKYRAALAAEESLMLRVRASAKLQLPLSSASDDASENAHATVRASVREVVQPARAVVNAVIGTFTDVVSSSTASTSVSTEVTTEEHSEESTQSDTSESGPTSSSSTGSTSSDTSVTVGGAVNVTVPGASVGGSGSGSVTVGL